MQILIFITSKYKAKQMILLYAYYIDIAISWTKTLVSWILLSTDKYEFDIRGTNLGVSKHYGSIHLLKTKTKNPIAD